MAPSGAVEWLCLPRVDSPSVFGALLDRDAGWFRLGPDAVSVPAARRYLPGTMVLETSWGTGSGWIIVRDVLLIGNWHHQHDRSHTHRRAPTDYDADHVLLRTIRCVNGEVQLLLDCEPKFDYGRDPAQWRYSGEDYHEGIAQLRRQRRARLTTDLMLGFEGSRATARHLLKEGEHGLLRAVLERAPATPDMEEAYERLVWTAHHWQHWLDRGDFPDHPWRTFLQRSALTLKGLTYAPSGALLAAATTSLPEAPQGERNWDYRYSWIRDSTFMLWALLRWASTGRPTTSSTSSPTSRRRGEASGHVRPGRRARARGAPARPPRGLRAGPPGAGRQRRLQAGAARRLGRAAGLRLPAHPLT